jgi:hypothetical protein
MIAVISTLAFATNPAVYVPPGEVAEAVGPTFIVPESRMDILLAKAQSADQLSTELVRASVILSETAERLRNLADMNAEIVSSSTELNIRLAESEARLNTVRRQRNSVALIGGAVVLGCVAGVVTAAAM